jgi:hypothetical protein
MGKWRYSATHYYYYLLQLGFHPVAVVAFLASDDVSRWLCAPTTLSQGKAPRNHWAGGWMGPTAGLDVLEKIYRITSYLRHTFFTFFSELEITVRLKFEVLFFILRKSQKHNMSPKNKWPR